MEGLAGAASLIAVIDISAKVAALCFQYSVSVKDSKNDIERIRNKVCDLERLINGVKCILEQGDKARLLNTNNMSQTCKQCLQELEHVKVRLEPGRTRRAMSRFGYRALKWPFTRKQVDMIISALESHRLNFLFALQMDQTTTVINLEQTLNLARLPIATGASYNSHSEEHNAQCLSNTRTDLLNEITSWASTNESKPIFWLSGMAGTGKSTIARTIAHSLATSKQLGASFFFKRGEGERGNASRFFSTIALDLSEHEPDMLPGINKALKNDSAISQRTLKDQFEQLLLQPLLDIKQAQSAHLGRVVVIDALDECEREQDVRVILQLLARTRSLKTVPLRIVVTSRPELHIRLGFKEMPNGAYRDLALHEVPRNTIEHDIRVFLEHELRAIQRQRKLSADWPAAHQVLALVNLAVPLFIHAATVCRYIGSPGGDPEEYLEKVLQYRTSSISQLDRTYLPILDHLLLEEEEDDREAWLKAFREVVGSIVVLASPLAIAPLSCLLQISQKKIRLRLDALHSVLHIPSDDSQPIRALHLSFREFLVEPRKKERNRFWVDETSTHKNLAANCVKIMCGPDGLCQDMCTLSQPGFSISNLSEKEVSHSLSPELQYASRYWIDHLQQSQQILVDGSPVHVFLQEHFLHWLEAMSLIRDSSRCVHLIESLIEVVSPTASIFLSFLGDARRFILRFQHVLADAPLQIYCAALMFAPENSIVRRAFADKTPPYPKLLSPRQSNWDASRSTLEGHTSHVQAIAFSPDEQTVISASADNSIRLWDTATGNCLETLDGHTGAITAIALSSRNEQLVASASEDHTVRIWDISTGMCRWTLEGHSGKVKAVAFSPSDGQLVMSASEDNTIRLWEVDTGTCHHTLKGHSGPIEVVEFSPPDGRLIVSASMDKTVQLWDTAKGTPYSTVKGHHGQVAALAFSPDGQLIALAFQDGQVRVWDVATAAYCCTLRGHSDYLLAVTFSTDGRLIASASSDGTVRLWDVATGTCLYALVGHTGHVMDVAFSPDGQLVASASTDTTIRLWEAATGTCYSVLEGHSNNITAIAFSPDGQLVASASVDKTIRLWDVSTGICCRTLEDCSEKTTGVAFESSGMILYVDEDEIPVLHPDMPTLPVGGQQQYPDVSVWDSWLMFNGNRVLWLPPELRTNVWAAHKDLVCFGLASGRVMIFQMS
ncbi:hypothetical protein ACN47E_000515 [Coniothyrium glycines]